MPMLATKPIPEGMHSLTACLWFNGNCKKAVEFYQKAFNAECMGPMAFDSNDKNRVLHAMLRIGDSCMMMADAGPGSPEKGPEGCSSVSMWIYMENCDAMFEQACKAGCEVMMPMMDAFWGDRMGKVRDPFGHCWALATQKMIMTEEETEKAKKEWEMSSKTPSHGTGCC